MQLPARDYFLFRQRMGFKPVNGLRSPCRKRRRGKVREWHLPSLSQHERKQRLEEGEDHPI